MLTIDITELGLGALGVASSIYEPWVGDTFAPVFVTLARSVGVTTLAGLGLVLLGAGAGEDTDYNNSGDILRCRCGRAEHRQRSMVDHRYGDHV